MKPLLPISVALCLFLPPIAHAGFDVVRSGKPTCTIVTAANAGPSVRLAVLELRSHVLRITGVELPVSTDVTPASGAQILVGESARTQELGLRGVDFGSQEYLISQRGDFLVLMGRDWRDTPENGREQGRATTGESLQESRHKIDYAKAVGLTNIATGVIELPGLYDDQGTCLAVYDFLERYCGVRWYGPAEFHVVIPQKSELSVEVREIRRRPALKHRTAFAAGNWPFLRTQWGEFTREQVLLHWRRLRQGGERWAGNHTFHRETIRELFKDPEYQCQNPKGLGSQLCYSNAKLVDQVVGMARDYFDGQGKVAPGWKAMGDYFTLVPDDNMQLCQCASCQAILKPGLARKSGQFASGEMSDYWFSFVNAVAREVKKTHPNKWIATLAYWAYSAPPNFPLEPNVSVAPCLQTCYFPVQKTVRDHEMGLFEEWRKKTSAPMFMWVYYHHPMEPGLIEKWKCFPHVMVHETARMMRGFLEAGVHGIFECGEQDQLEQYVMAKIWDDPTLSVDAMIDEFFDSYFGAAGVPMNAFYRKLELIACDPGHYEGKYTRSSGIDWKRVAWERLGTAERMKDLGRLMDDASRLVQSGSAVEKARFGAWKKALWDWMREGREEALKR